MARHIALMEASVSTTPTVPVLTGLESNSLNGGQQILIDIKREASEDGSGIVDDDAVCTVYGANLTNPHLTDDTQHATQRGQVFKGDGSTTAFTTEITHAVWSNYNWIVVVRDSSGVTVCTRSGSASTKTEYDEDDNGGSGRITFGAAPDDGAIIEVYFVVPVSLVATAAGDLFKEADVTSYDFLWAALSGTQIGASNVYIKPLVA